MTLRKFIALVFVLLLAPNTIGNNVIITDWPQWQGPPEIG